MVAPAYWVALRAAAMVLHGVAQEQFALLLLLPTGGGNTNVLPGELRLAPAVVGCGWEPCELASVAPYASACTL